MLSFIIPTYNEESNIGKTIKKIYEYNSNEDFEVHVVDNGSDDNTVAIARSSGATCSVLSSGTIAALRNLGVRKTHGDILIFIDADISLTAMWEQNIKAILDRIRAGERILTGSWYCVPEESTWIESFWFKPLERSPHSHINSGHMIISRKDFEAIGGFDEALETGEDYDISIRAQAKGIKIEDNAKLKVIHEGYPKGLKKFAEREYWHGKGDAVSLTSILASKVAITSVIILALTIVFIFSTTGMLGLYAPVVTFLTIYLLCFASSVYKFRAESAVIILVNSIIFYIYYVSRSASILSRLYAPQHKKRQR
ncbi:MAG: glycosyltransferase [Saccharospirillum sp.]|nr:glycosyltransferase [Saccharospirillum sp.]